MESSMIIESHRRAATVYLCGELSSEIALRAEAAAVALPPETEILRFDLLGVRRVEAGAFSAIVRAMVHWRMKRRAHSHITFPPRVVGGAPPGTGAAPRCFLRPDSGDSAGTLHA